MVTTSALVITSVVCLFVGAGIGLLIQRTLLSSGSPKDVEAKYNALQDEYQQYQQNVAQHFVDTSRFVIEAQQRERDLREHLVSGALQLTSAEVSRAILAQHDEQDSESNTQLLDNLDPASLKAPTDWAPKTPGSSGVLSEEFGLKEEQEDTDSIEVKTATLKSTS